MDNQFDAIDKALDVKSEIVEKSKEPKAIAKVDEDPEKDYEYSRAQLYTLIDKGQEAVDGILELAQDSQHPRAFEVAGQLIKSVGDVTEKLIDLQKKMKDLEKPQGGQSPKTVNNTMFVGSTADLQKMLNQGLLNNDSE